MARLSPRLDAIGLFFLLNDVSGLDQALAVLRRADVRVQDSGTAYLLLGAAGFSRHLNRRVRCTFLPVVHLFDHDGAGNHRTFFEVKDLACGVRRSTWHIFGLDEIVVGDAALLKDLT